MSNSEEDHALSPKFNVKDYVEATNNAARRTRTVTIVLVVVSVLIAIGWYNSLQWSWDLHRIRQAYDPHDPYVSHILGVNGTDDESKIRVEKFRTELQQATVKAYVENVRFIKAPFFGVAFDVNDLGVVGGVGLIITLLLMRYSLSREIKNLNVSLREAVHHDKLPAFYHALAMRQVFTVPHMKGEKRNRWLASAPRVICILPACVFFLGVFYDYFSVWLYVYLLKAVTFTVVIQTVLLIVILYLVARCWERQGHIDSIWEQYWNRIEGHKSAVILLNHDLVQEFGSDDYVDRALRRFRLEAWDANTPF
jgi:hypothetical protein